MNKVPRRNFMKTAVGLAAGLVFSGFSAVVSAEEANPRTKMTEEEKRLVQIIIKTCVKPDDLKFLIEGIKILEFFRNMGKRIFVPKELRESFFNLKKDFSDREVLNIDTLIWESIPLDRILGKEAGVKNLRAELKKKKPNLKKLMVTVEEDAERSFAVATLFFYKLTARRYIGYEEQYPELKEVQKKFPLVLEKDANSEFVQDVFEFTKNEAEKQMVRLENEAQKPQEQSVEADSVPVTKMDSQRVQASSTINLVNSSKASMSKGLKSDYFKKSQE